MKLVQVLSLDQRQLFDLRRQYAIANERAELARTQVVEIQAADRVLEARAEAYRLGIIERIDREVAPLHSMTSSARANSVAGTVMPRARAVLRLITNSYLDRQVGRLLAFQDAINVTGGAARQRDDQISMTSRHTARRYDQATIGERLRGVGILMPSAADDAASWGAGQQRTTAAPLSPAMKSRRRMQPS